MKKFIPYLLLMLLMPAFFSSCKKDDKPLNTPEKWIFNKVIEEEYSSADVVVNIITDTNWTVNDYLILYTDGNFELVQDGEKIAGTYRLENSVMTFSIKKSSTEYSTIKVTVLEKSPTKFTFYSDKMLQNVKYRSTVYLKN